MGSLSQRLTEAKLCGALRCQNQIRVVGLLEIGDMQVVVTESTEKAFDTFSGRNV